MADEIKLGVLGSEYTLAIPVWPSGSPPEMPEEFDNRIDSEDMLDGSRKYDFREHAPRTWQLNWDGLTAAELADLIAVNALRQELNYINTYMGVATGTIVVVRSFSWSVRLETWGRPTRYVASMTLEEVL